MFGDEDLIDILIKNELFFMDATFKIVPKQFHQLLIIQSMYKGKKYPLIYCLMKDKSEDSYIKVFKTLKNFNVNFEKKHFVIDFEYTMYIALKKEFHNIEIFGC